MLRLADLDPLETGLKVTETLQLALAARLEPQVVVELKSSDSPPITAIEVNVNVAVPLLVTVTVLAGEEVPAD